MTPARALVLLILLLNSVFATLYDKKGPVLLINDQNFKEEVIESDVNNFILLYQILFNIIDFN